MSCRYVCAAAAVIRIPKSAGSGVNMKPARPKGRAPAAVIYSQARRYVNSRTWQADLNRGSMVVRVLRCLCIPFGSYMQWGCSCWTESLSRLGEPQKTLPDAPANAPEHLYTYIHGSISCRYLFLSVVMYVMCLAGSVLFRSLLHVSTPNPCRTHYPANLHPSSTTTSSPPPPPPQQDKEKTTPRTILAT